MTIGFMNPDHVTRVAVFGCRFVDAATGRPVTSGLSVTLFPAKKPHQQAQAMCTRSGVYTVHRVPGMGTLDMGAGDAAFWAKAQTQTQDYVAEVRDLLGRYLPMSWHTTAPTLGPFDTSGTAVSAAGLPEPIALYAHPHCVAPSSMAVVRAHLRDKQGQAHVLLRHALLRISYAGKQIAQGFANEDGQVAVVFAHPEPASVGDPGKSFRWDLSFTLHPAAPPDGTEPPPSILPDRQDLLDQDQQVPWHLLDTINPDTQATTELGAVSLQMGRELVLKTRGMPHLAASPN